MARKKALNLAIPEQLLDEFNEACQIYGHGKQKGMVLSAAILMFLRAEPEVQGRYLEEVIRADVSAGVERMIERIRKEQALLLSTREAAERAQRGEPGNPPPQRKAAKKAGRPRRGLKHLPRIDDLEPRDEPESKGESDPSE
ncbi:MAG: hypothetical protein ACLFV3_05940 [Phycisphaeraceae bacterium]